MERQDQHQSGHQGHQGNYGTFFAMIITSMVAMYLLMYLNTYAFDHVFFSETRFYMTFIMGAAMAVIMLSFMLNMYKNRSMNIAIYVGSVVVFALALWLVRSQTLVEDQAWMRAMIPHHSIAILTSENAQIEDQRVKDLANEIIEAQRREIAEMKWLLEDIAENGIADSEADAEARPIPDFSGE